MPIQDIRPFVYPILAPDTPIPDGVFEDRVLWVRQRALSSCDWRMLPDAPGDQAAWETYRAELRDGAAILATRDGDLVTLPDPPEEG